MSQAIESKRLSQASNPSLASHGRVETQLLEKEHPIKSQRVNHYSGKKSAKKNEQGQRHGDIYKKRKNHKERTLSEFSCLIGNKLSLRLQNLKVLSASHFEQKQNLTHLDLRNNRLRRIPDAICDLILMREIRLDYNFLAHLPFGFDRLKHLQFLSASQNLLKVLPQTIFSKDSQLEFLLLNDNKLTKLSNKVGRLSKLKCLLLHNNSIYDLPASLGHLHLQEFSLDWFIYLFVET